MEYYLSLLVQLKGILKKNRHCKNTKGVFSFHENATAHPALSNKTDGPSWGSNILIPTLFFRIGPVGLPSDRGLKIQLKNRHFSYDVEVISAAENWLDGKTLIFFECLAKVTATG